MGRHFSLELAREGAQVRRSTSTPKGSRRGQDAAGSGKVFTYSVNVSKEAEVAQRRRGRRWRTGGSHRAGQNAGIFRDGLWSRSTKATGRSREAAAPSVKFGRRVIDAT